MITDHGTSGSQYSSLVDSLLNHAAAVKDTTGIEPPLTESDLGAFISKAQSCHGLVATNAIPRYHNAMLESAFRDKFYGLLNTTSLDDPAFVEVWNLLDIVSIFSDNAQCEPGLIFWLVEELLDSQTIEGCRRIFDYLESRRARNIAKHFREKSLIILRCCNELLRRLSRAEDTVFCGRVFIFLFQSFPLGDRSSVNLRGEFHVENETAYDSAPQAAKELYGGFARSSSAMEAGPMLWESKASQNTNSFETGKSVGQDEPLFRSEHKDWTTSDMDSLYPIVWSLQEDFCSPVRLFDRQRFHSFKSGLETTISIFKSVKHNPGRHGSGHVEEAKRGTKRRWSTDDKQSSATFNPKYLTSRELFDLEIHDVAFQRHILVQGLILLEFLLSLTPQGKSRLAELSNKSVLYGFTLNEDNARWATQIKSDIAAFLQTGTEGKFYYRMVDTVLSRDKNWVRWKAEGCPRFEKSSLTTEEYQTAKQVLAKSCVTKKLRLSPLGSMNFGFLSEQEAKTSLDRLSVKERYLEPDLPALKSMIDDSEFDVDLAQDGLDKAAAIDKKSSQLWRTLRVASKLKLTQFDQIEDGKRWRILFSTPTNESRAARSNEMNDLQEESEDIGVTSSHAEPNTSNSNSQGTDSKGSEAQTQVSHMVLGAGITLVKEQENDLP